MTSAAQAAIAQWLRDYLANLLEHGVDEFDDTLSFERMGLDSSAAVGMVGDLGDWLGHEIDASAAYDHPSIRALSSALAGDPAVRRAFGQRRGDDFDGEARTP
jgi:acyl carrier protein